MKELKNREDLLHLMIVFYKKLFNHSMMAPVFIDVAKVDLEKHLPHLVDFWENNLFKANGYNRNVKQMHLDLNAKIALTASHFENWLTLLKEAIDENYFGEKANELFRKASNIAQIMQIKIQHV